MKKLSEFLDSPVVLVTNHDDWEALYINGKCDYQAHNIDTKSLVKACLEHGKMYNLVYSSYDELMNVGNYPDTLDDIPEWIEITLSDDSTVNPS